MRSSVEDNKGWIGPSTPEISNGFEFQKGSNRTPNHHHRPTIGKPAPSKWDDAQKWLSGVGFGRGRGGGEKNSHHHSRSNKPRNSNADDLRLIASASQREREGENQYVEYEDEETAAGRLEVETKNVDCGEQVWRKENHPTAVIRSVCVRDMGTEMTPFGSQEPSRTATPVRATTPVGRSPVTSPVRGSHGGETVVATETEVRRIESSNNEMSNGFGEEKKEMSAMEARAMAWDEAERAKFMARYKREEVKIQAWENHEKRKAEMEMKKMEVKAERMKARAEEKLANKLAATKRIAEERRANAEAKLNEEAVRTSEKADYIRRTGHLPSSFSFSFKLPSRCCWCK